MIGELIQGIMLNAYFKHYEHNSKKEAKDIIGKTVPNENTDSVSDNSVAGAYHHDADDTSFTESEKSSISKTDIKDFVDTFSNVSEEIKVASGAKAKVEPVKTENTDSTFKGTESTTETIAIYSNETTVHHENDVTSDQVPIVKEEPKTTQQQVQSQTATTENPAGDGWLKNDPAATSPVKKKPDPKAKADKATSDTDTDPIKENISNIVEKNPEGRKKNYTQKDIFNMVKNAFGPKGNDITFSTNATMQSAAKVAENNSDLDFITEIEKIANSRGYRIEVRTQCWPNSNIPTGMIEIITLDNNNVMVPDKSFTIDTGCIIDRRRKLIAGINMGNTCYEMMPIYEIKTKDPNSKKKVLDRQLIESIFAGGLNSIRKREMYDSRLKELNTIVDLSTIGNCPSDLKHEITSRLENAYFNTPTFTDVLNNNRGAAFRFRITSVNATTREFELTMDNGTCFFGIPNQGIIKKYSIKFKSDGTCEVTVL